MSTQKTIIVVILLLVIAPILWYTLSPIWNVVELDEPLPGDVTSKKENPPIMGDLQQMSPEQKIQFEKAMEEMKDKVIEMNEEMGMPMIGIIAEGNFQAQAHEVKGRARLIRHDDKTILRFEDFETINGPDLHIYLSQDLGTADFVDLGKIRATKGNVNYTVDPSIDTTKYRNVLVWCEPFSVLFSYAELK